MEKRFGSKVALDGVGFEVQAGEVVALAGHNGAGKTTTIHLLLGLLRPDGGRLRVLGKDPLERRHLSQPSRAVPGGYGIWSGHLATLADGTALWVAAQCESSRPVYALAPGWSEPRRVCELPPNSLPTAFAGIEDGPEGRRAVWIPGFSLDPESPAPMVSCLLSRDA